MQLSGTITCAVSTISFKASDSDRFCLSVYVNAKSLQLMPQTSINTTAPLATEDNTGLGHELKRLVRSLGMKVAVSEVAPSSAQ